MLFNSIDFAIFLPVVFSLYWFVVNKSLKWQNLLIAVSSCIFYGWWDWKFLGLLLFSALVDYLVGLGLRNEQNQAKRKALLWLSLVVNLGMLGFFKYYNFFIESFAASFSFFGSEIEISSLNIILPVGISFYTFQTLSYSIDVYKRRLEPTQDFIAFLAFISFFPQLVAGPIERATHLLPQFYTKRTFDYAKAVDGMRQILWGLFKKIVIADSCAEYVNLIFNNLESYSGSTIVLVSVLFAFQVYGDFSGYSDIAIGTSRLFGFSLMQNFNFPFFSRTIVEFWQRWHISLLSWFRDYIYLPLAGRKTDKWTRIKLTFVVFIVSGLWHGANWTFVVWGALNAAYSIPYLLADKKRRQSSVVAKGKTFPSLKELWSMIFTFSLFASGSLWFRSTDMSQVIIGFKQVFSVSLFTIPRGNLGYDIVGLIGIIIVFILIEWQGREGQYGIANLGLKWRRSLRYAFYYAIILAIYFLGGEEQQFIYFQF